MTNTDHLACLIHLGPLLWFSDFSFALYRFDFESLCAGDQSKGKRMTKTNTKYIFSTQIIFKYNNAHKLMMIFRHEEASVCHQSNSMSFFSLSRNEYYGRARARSARGGPEGPTGEPAYR